MTDQRVREEIDHVLAMGPKLPPKGERPVFGVHRQRPEDAATAPAGRVETEQQRERRWRRELKAWARKQPVEPEPAEEPCEIHGDACPGDES